MGDNLIPLVFVSFCLSLGISKHCTLHTAHCTLLQLQTANCKLYVHQCQHNADKFIKVMAEEALRKSVNAGNRGKKRLKKFGKAYKLDYYICRLCLKHSKHYNKPESLNYEAVMSGALKEYGCTPLHAWMRCMECFLKASEAKLVAESESGMSRKEARRHLQGRFCSSEGNGLWVFFPCPKGGNTNSGPTARRFFRNSDVTAKILDCPKESVNFKFYE